MHVPAVVPGIITANMHSNATLEQSQMSQATNVQTGTNVNYFLMQSCELQPICFNTWDCSDCNCAFVGVPTWLSSLTH